ncbi:MAG: VWA domain-containing protein [Planctomycetota bacterium]
MNFQYPGFLWLLPLVLLVWFVPRRPADARRALLRTVVLVALLLGLARPVLVRSSWSDHHVVVVDRTGSVADPAAVDRALAAVVQKLQPDAVRVLVEIGERAGATDAPAGFDQLLQVRSRGRSPLGDALHAALRAIPAGTGGAITLISDGRGTDSGWQRAVQELTERDLPLHVVAVPAADTNARPVGIVPLDELRVGHVGRVRVAVAAADAELQVTLKADGEVVGQPVALTCRGVATVDLPFEPRASGFVDLTVEVARTDAAEQDPSDDTRTRTVAVQEPLRVLYLGGRVQQAGEHLGQLLGDGFELRQPAGDAIDLADVDLTVLDDRAAAEVPTAWQQAIADAVQQRGMGLLVSGGRSAFGPGGYHDTVIETISPVEYVQKEEKKDPSTTLAVVIDTSGSMVGNRMTLAKEVARLAIRRLLPHDKVGIVEFYGTKQWAAPIQSAANSIDLQRAINRLGASGGTVLFPAIEECYYALKNVQTRYKHVLVITDAGVETGPYENLLRKMADEGIATSTVLVGPGRHSEFLVELADWGGGRYYHSPDRFNLPELLLKKPSTSMLPPYRPGNYAVETRGGRGWWGDVDPKQIPPVETLVETSARPGADVLMSVQGSGRPVLASWRYGLGRVTAMTTEPVGPGTRGWRDWDGYGPMLARLLARTSRSSQPPFSFLLRRDAEHLYVEARRATRGASAPRVAVADGAEVDLREVAPGVFAGVHVAAASDDVRLLATDGSGWRHHLCSDALDGGVPETQVDPREALPLPAIATHTGGAFVAVGAAAPALSLRRSGTPLQVVPLWPWLVLLSLLAFLFDVFDRRRGAGTRRPV